MLEYVPIQFDISFGKPEGVIGEACGRYFMHQLVEILWYLHIDKKVAHLDVKSGNLLLDQNLDIKLTDFGCASYNQIDKLNEYTGTRPYMAPEIIEGDIFDGCKADIFSLGVLLF